MFESADALARLRDLPTQAVETFYERAESIEHQARHATLLALTVLDERNVRAGAGATDTEAWVSARSRCTRATARAQVRAARALSQLPRVADAAGAGRLSWDQLDSVVQLADADTDAMWARDGAVMAPQDLQREVRKHMLVTRKAALQRHRERELRIWSDHAAGMVRFTGAVSDADGAIVVRAIELEAAKLGRRPDGSWESLDARRADALVALATQRLADDTDPARALLVVTAPAAALLDQSSTAGSELLEVDLGLAIDTVRRLACDATTQVIFELQNGCPVAVGRQTRTVPRWMWRQLLRRDRSCRFPGCDRTRGLHAHHMVHWADGGPTDLANLILLCPYHHRYLHEHGWVARGDPMQPGGVEFLNRARRMVTNRPTKTHARHPMPHTNAANEFVHSGPSPP